MTENGENKREISRNRKLHKIVLYFMTIFDEICIVYSDKIKIHPYKSLTNGQVGGYTPDKRSEERGSRTKSNLKVEWSDMK